MRSNKTLKYFTRLIRRTPSLEGRERSVILGRLRKQTLVEIGKSWGLTEGRIRQIEKSALEKISAKGRQLALFRKLKQK